MNKVDILLAPYNYVISGFQIKNSLSIRDKIIIFDEGHNIEQYLEESSSISINKSQLNLVIDLIKEDLNSHEFYKSLTVLEKLLRNVSLKG